MLKVDFGDVVAWVVGLGLDFERGQDFLEQKLQVLAPFNFDKRRVDVVLLQELHHVLQFGQVGDVNIVHFRVHADGSVIAEPDVHAEVSDGFRMACVNVFVPEVEPQVA